MIRNLIESDVPRISEIHCLGWRTAYRNIISEKYLYSKLSVYDRMQRFFNNKEFEDPTFFVFEEDGLIKAFMKTGPCRNEDKKDSFELWGIYVEPHMQRRGIGNEMLSFCERMAVEQGYREIVLWVLCKNDKARRFYEKHGYVHDGKTDYMENIDAEEMRYIKELTP